MPFCYNNVFPGGWFIGTIYIKNDSFAYYLFCNQLCSYLLGILCFLVRNNLKTVKMRIVAYLAVIMLLLTVLVFYSSLELKYVLIPPLMGFHAFFLFLFLGRLQLRGKMCRGLALLGTNSFCIYLVHMVVVWTAAEYLKNDLIVYFPFNYQFLFSVIIHKWAEEAPILLYWRTFIMNRGGGVLMHIASLPGPFGIGVLGEEAVAYAKQLHKQGMKYWQILPLSYPGMGDSPYQSFSAFAGNWLLIDPRSLMKMGLLTAEDVVKAEYSENKWRVNYDFLRVDREAMLRKAFSRADKELLSKVNKFLKENKWADDVALYQSAKDKFNQKAWWQWEDQDLVNYKPEAVKKLRSTEDYVFHGFVQYIFTTEWADIRAKINAEGIQIIGDMPIYVSGDSADVWAARDLFKMATDAQKKACRKAWIKENPDKDPDKDYEDVVFECGAGVPPDYFSADGQLWGNPIYDWKKHKETGYAWWMERLKENFKLYDIIRIDHFRAFSSYWEVPAGSKTAKTGKWVEGPKMDFFKVFDKTFGDRSRLIAEDLGEVTPDLESFLNEVDLPRMKIMQFAFNPDDNSSYLPHNYVQNCVAYTGTHDNNTLLGWLWEASDNERRECLKYCGFEGDNWGDGGVKSKSCRAIIKTLWASCANTVIIPIQDMLGYGGDTRMNIPGTPEGNWRIRFTKEDLDSLDDDWYRELNRLYRR